MEKFDVVIVGAGLTGSIIARHFAEVKNKKVLILEKRNHIAGNLYDYFENGLYRQEYGPHIFHTNFDNVKEYIFKFSKWNDFKLECNVYMNDKLTASPFNFSTIDLFYDGNKRENLKLALKAEFPNQISVPVLQLLNSNNQLVKEYAEFLFENDYRPYTAKQWGIQPEEIDPSVLARVPVYLDYNKNYFNDRHQFMPEDGFTSFISNILNHDNISLKLNVDANKILEKKHDRIEIDNQVPEYVIYTGPIDSFFDYEFGKLPYRSLRFEYKKLNIPSFQPVPVVAYPQEKGFTRITEFSKLIKCESKVETIIAYEYPLQFDNDSEFEPYYPIPNEQNSILYRKYSQLAGTYKNLNLCGRLGKYKYINMDVCIKEALEFCLNLNEELSI